MKIQKAISMMLERPVFWFRPVAWDGTGKAYTLKDGMIHLVPTPHGGEPGVTADAKLLAGEWEVIDPNIVLWECRNG